VAQTIEHFLDIYRVRLSCQEQGITNPPDIIKTFTSNFVRELELHDKLEQVEIVELESGDKEFILVGSGKVLGKLPAE